MIRCSRRLERLAVDEAGLTTVEYVIVLAMIAVLAVGLWRDFGDKLSGYLKAGTATIDKEMPRQLKASP